MYRIRIDTGPGAFAVAKHTAVDALKTLRDMREDHPTAVVFSREGKKIDEEQLERLAARAAEPAYVSSNGDRWHVEIGPDGEQLVRHTGNPASGGHVTEWSAEEFLKVNPASPEHQAVRGRLDQPS